MCYHTECGRSGSNGTTVRTEIRRNNCAPVIQTIWTRFFQRFRIRKDWYDFKHRFSKYFDNFRLKYFNTTEISPSTFRRSATDLAILTSISMQCERAWAAFQRRWVDYTGPVRYINCRGGNSCYSWHVRGYWYNSARCALAVTSPCNF